MKPKNGAEGGHSGLDDMAACGARLKPRKHVKHVKVYVNKEPGQRADLVAWTKYQSCVESGIFTFHENIS